MNCRLSLVFVFSLLVFPLFAQEIVMKDGAVHKATEMRREGQFIFYKTLSPNTSVTEGVVGVAQIQNIVFPELDGFAEARIAAARGYALRVLRVTEPLVPAVRLHADLPGSQWADLMRVHVPALVAGGSSDAVSALQRQWTSTGDIDVDNAAKVLFLNYSDREKAGLAWAALAKPGASSLGAAISWLGIGQEALESKKWGVALRSFLSVELFVPAQRVLHPGALLGAIRGMLGAGDEVQARKLLAELKSEYPDTPEYNSAARLLP
jgi:hypothetical protein